MVQPWVPGEQSRHESVHVAPGSHVTWQLWSAHVNAQWLPAPQAHVPFAHVPAQRSLSPAHATWHGPFEHPKSQLLPRAQVQSPFAHVPLHDSPRQSTWHGDTLHAN
jgi:hypothetical protein